MLPALAAFSDLRAPDARALVEMSHKLDQGFVHFILPMIVDGIFHKAAPWLFSSSIVRMMQDPSWRFSDTQKKKRVDRGLQAAVLLALVAAAAAALRQAVRWLVGCMQAVPVV